MHAWKSLPTDSGPMGTSLALRSNDVIMFKNYKQCSSVLSSHEQDFAKCVHRNELKLQSDTSHKSLTDL